MNSVQLKKLKKGDIVRHLGTGDSYVVDANYGDFVTGMRTVNISNPSEWMLFTPGQGEIQKPEHNTGSLQLPTEIELSKCRYFDECRAGNKGHVGCYSTGPCFGLSAT